MRKPGSRRIRPAESPDSLLIGWAEIATYARKRPRCLQRWVFKHRFPVLRLGRYVMTSRRIIDAWLFEQMVRQHEQRAQRP